MHAYLVALVHGQSVRALGFTTCMHGHRMHPHSSRGRQPPAAHLTVNVCEYSCARTACTACSCSRCIEQRLHGCKSSRYAYQHSVLALAFTVHMHNACRCAFQRCCKPSAPRLLDAGCQRNHGLHAQSLPACALTNHACSIY